MWKILMGGAAAVAGGAYIKRKNDIDVLAHTLYGEARGEGVAGMQAVANVIMNRYKAAGWFSAPTIAGVAQKAYQFSTWNKSDPNYRKIVTVTESDPQFALAKTIATNAVNGKLADITGGATHYHTTAVSPPWAAGATRTAQIGSHIFYKGVA